MIKTIFVLLLTLFSFRSIAQNPYYDSIYRVTAQELIASDPKQALKNVEQLSSISTNRAEQLKSLLLKAALLRTYGINNEALDILFKTDSIAHLEKDYVSITRINGLIATIYRESQLNAAATIYFKKTKEAIEKIENENLKNRFRGSIEQESAQIELKKENYLKTIKHINQSNEYFLLAGETADIPFHLSSNYGQIGTVYLLLDEIDSTFFYLNRALNELTKAQAANSPKKGFIYTGLAEAYIKIDSLELAEDYLHKSKSIAEKSNYFELKKETYFKLSNFYKKTGDHDKFIQSNEQYLKLINDDQEEKKRISNLLIESLYEKEQNSITKQRSSSKKITLLTSSVFLLIILLGWYIYSKRQSKKKFLAYIENKNNYENKAKDPSPEKPTAAPETKSKSYMSEEKETEILKKLLEIEKTNFYLDENISLSTLSGKLGVNQRYLTHVIKTHKKSDFSSYINALRINYIVDCIKSDPKFLMYKISYLAELCGFASHSRFSINFKKVTGTTPSAFIAYVKNENEKIN
ncbi:helix-turn-helix domain-containing protein [Brumimicrobium oceani]|uniref:HTH araC/xylS-type domain-containing protein n=1 Tax=Brumimicrobium oceani TaxID=2100725 RepID=A0A2U2XCA4_9FLAO|nr:helix-turn-helix transcriptional regulator [Brumimicrobium oceani]PWH85422.1 hypothetical protein DIT68_09190 [Brumimicrobium oceani]